MRNTTSQRSSQTVPQQQSQPSPQQTNDQRPKKRRLQNENSRNLESTPITQHSNSDNLEMEETNDVIREANLSDSSEDETLASNFQQQKQDEKLLFKEKIKFQRRALFRKNATLQMRQVGTNLCQIITPIIGLLIIVALREMGSSNLKLLAGTSLYIPIPYIFNIPYKPFSTLGQFFNITDCNQWYMYQFDDKVKEEDKQFWGENKGFPMEKPYSQGMINGKNNILEYPCKEINRSVPYFEELYKKNNVTTNSYLSSTLSKLHEQEIDFNAKNYDVKYLEELPDGAITVQESNKQKLKYKLQINDNRYWQYHRNNGVTKLGIVDETGEEEEGVVYMERSIEGQIQIADLINQAYIKEIFNDTNVVSGIQFMPFKPGVDNELEKLINLIGLAVFPACLCLALPVYLYNLVLEKETKLVEIMKINGMKMRNYWLVNFAFCFLIYCITAGFYSFTGAFIFKLNFFTCTNWKMMLLLYFGWGICQISMAFFFSVFLNSSQTASIIGYSLSIWIATLASSLNITIYSMPNMMPNLFYLFPTFPYCRVMYHLAMECAYKGCLRDISALHPEAQFCLIVIYVEAVIYLVLALYLYQVVPQTYGVAKHPLFFLKKLISKKSFLYKIIFKVQDYHELAEQDMKDLNSQEDQDAKQERQKVYRLDSTQYYKHPLIVKDVRKVYPGFSNRPPKVANKSMCLKIKRGELFGLLGPNGAGKTTLISMLTGMYKPTAGNAWMSGYDIKNQLELVQLQIGVCPQFDIMWNDLTVEEHLLFYARLKGVPPNQENNMVNKALDEVQLTKERDILTRLLPLGMKRRLSIAIALVANPKIVFLDEPTTGLDPETRRQLWNILQDCRNDKKRAMVLTTHSMEEADVLCNRIGIVNDGVLRCIGSQVRLKTLYGGGYHLFVNCQRTKYLKLLVEKRRLAEQRHPRTHLTTDEDHSFLTTGIINRTSRLSSFDIEEDDEMEVAQIHSQVIQFVQKLLPQAFLLREFNGNFVYQIPVQGFNAERLFIEMEKNKEKLRIADWGISQCSLEDVFTRICSL